MNPSFEQPSSFYLGKRFDAATRSVTDEALLYDSKDLTTHAVCVGMTGSGKTGLCLSMLEEAALDGIPTIAIDPKGDIGNLCLTFPKLSPSDFQPWIDPGEAARKGETIASYAKKVASQWKAGLADWGQTGERIKRLRNSADVSIYTPGSNAGKPMSVLRSFTAPSPELLADSDALSERVNAAVSGLLAMLGLNADPIQSREHILLANIVLHAWQQGNSLDLASLIRHIQTPPFSVVGVFDLDTFYPPSDRLSLAMRLNNLLASPGFSTWMQGQPLNIPELLWSPDGKPRISIISIAHLSESERMFLVTILLSELLAWIRSQPGTTSLRALLYMDEVFGFFPPTANPPSKKPMLTLLKQARAYGLGVMLATQNPVDLDYKGLSNTGTWFLGRLQTERDQMRVLDGLEGASGVGRFDRQQMQSLLAGLGSRVFVMNNVHDREPVVFHTRWAMSYLRGPLTTAQIKTLSQEGTKQAKSTSKTASATAPPTPVAPTSPAFTPAPVIAAPKAPAADRRAAAASEATRPILPAGVKEVFIASDVAVPRGHTLEYRPALLAKSRLHYSRASYKIDAWQEVTMLAALDGAVDPWESPTELTQAPDTASSPIDGATFRALPDEAMSAKRFKQWESSLKGTLYRDRPMNVLRCDDLRAYSLSNETEAEFRARLAQTEREERDEDIEKMRKRYGPKLARIEERIRKAEQKIEREEAQYKNRRTSAFISLGSTVLGAMFGRKLASRGNVSRAASTARASSSAKQQKADIARAEEDLIKRKDELETLELEFNEEIAVLQAAIDPTTFELRKCPLAPRKTDIEVTKFQLAWMPWTVSPTGVAQPAFVAEAMA